MRKAILLIITSIMIFIFSVSQFTILEYSNSNIQEIIEVKLKVEEVTESVNIEKTGTLDNITFIADVIDVNKMEDGGYLVIGNTATEKNYSGKIHIIVKQIDDIELDKTYTFIVEPLMSMSTPPVVTEVIHSESTDNDIRNLHEYRKLISNYNSKIFEYKDMNLYDIIEDSNKNYYTWTNDEISQFKRYLEDLGYDETFEIQPIVDIRSIPN